MHINKCAGSSFYMWMHQNNIAPFGGSKGDHKIESIFLPEITNITTVRNPYDRMKSVYNQWKNNGWLKDIHLSDAGTSKPFTFSEFVKLLPECYENNNSNTLIKETYLGQWGHLKDFESPVGIRFIKPCSYWMKYIDKFKIFYFENLEEINSFFTNKGFHIKNGISNVIDGKTTTERKKSYIEYYTENEIKIINDLFHDDFVNFNYEKVKL